MKLRKILSMVLAGVMLCSFAGCGSKSSEKTESVSSNEPSVKEEPAKGEIAELYGYKFAFNYPIEDKGFVDGFKGQGENYSIMIVKKNKVKFNSWDTVVKDYQDALCDAVYTAFRFMGIDISVIDESLFINAQGCEIYKVNAILKNVNEEQNIMAYYYLDEDNGIHCWVSLIKEGFEKEIKESMDCMAEHFEKSK